MEILNDGAEALRDLVETVTVSRRIDGKTEAQIAGRLTALLGGPAFPSGVRAMCGSVVAEDRGGQDQHQGVLDLMVAEEGLEPPTRGL
jgi:hypothetical protein